MGTRAAGGYVGMSEGWLGTVCALFLRSFNAATTLLEKHADMQIAKKSRGGGLGLLDSIERLSGLWLVALAAVIRPFSASRRAGSWVC